MVVHCHRQNGHRYVAHHTQWFLCFAQTDSRFPGILAIFVWRIFAKFLLHRILPPIFRFLAQLVTLPHRRYYTPATDYKNVPPDNGLRPFPSVLDLPGMVELDATKATVSTARSRRSGTNNARLRAGRSAGQGRGETKGKKDVFGSGHHIVESDSELGGRAMDIVKHYDADGKWL